MTYSAVRALVESTLDHFTVTAEVAGSSPAVPAVLSKVQPGHMGYTMN